MTTSITAPSETGEVHSACIHSNNELERISMIVNFLWYLYFQPFSLDSYTFTIKRYKELSYVNYVIAVRMKTRLIAWGGWWPGLGRAGMWCDPCCCWRSQHRTPPHQDWGWADQTIGHFGVELQAIHRFSQSWKRPLESAYQRFVI